MSLGADLIAAAALADPAEAAPAPRPAPEGTSASPEGVVAILRSNKVALLDLRPVRGDGRLADSESWRAAIALESGEREGLAVEWSQVASLLEAAGMTPVLFKSPGGLPYRSSNLDVLIRPAEMEAAARILEEAGHLRLPHYREPHKLLYRKFKEGRSVICVHLHEAVSWGRLLILPGDDVIDRSRAPAGDACRVASREDLLLITLAHSLYETDQVRMADLRVLRLCAGRGGFDWAEAIRRVERRGWAPGFYSILLIAAAVEAALYGSSSVPVPVLDDARAAVSATPWASRYVVRVRRGLERRLPADPLPMPYPLSKAYSKIHYLARLATEPTRTPDEHAADIIAMAWSLLANRLHLRSRPAALVSLSGVDGAGKSSAAVALREAMALCEVPVRLVWTRGGFSAGMGRLKDAARRALRGRVPGPGQPEAKRRWLSRPALGGAYAAVVVIEQAMQSALRVRALLWLGDTVVCDRYAWDTAADLKAKLGGRAASRAAGWALTSMARRPDLAILLRLPAAAAARRKPGDQPPEWLEAQARELDRLAVLHDLVVIDALRPAADVINDVVEAGLRAAFARFDRR